MSIWAAIAGGANQYLKMDEERRAEERELNTFEKKEKIREQLEIKREQRAAKREAQQVKDWKLEQDEDGNWIERGYNSSGQPTGSVRAADPDEADIRAFNRAQRETGLVTMAVDRDFARPRAEQEQKFGEARIRNVEADTRLKDRMPAERGGGREDTVIPQNAAQYRAQLQNDLAALANNAGRDISTSLEGPNNIIAQINQEVNAIWEDPEIPKELKVAAAQAAIARLNAQLSRSIRQRSGQIGPDPNDVMATDPRAVEPVDLGGRGGR